jgi:hypothetical protein
LTLPNRKTISPDFTFNNSTDGKTWGEHIIGLWINQKREQHMFFPHPVDTWMSHEGWEVIDLDINQIIATSLTQEQSIDLAEFLVYTEKEVNRSDTVTSDTVTGDTRDINDMVNIEKLKEIIHEVTCGCDKIHCLNMRSIHETFEEGYPILVNSTDLVEIVSRYSHFHTPPPLTPVTRHPVTFIERFKSWFNK